MPKVKYVGPFDEVEIDGVGVVKKNAVVELEPELGRSLLEQADNWVRPSPKASPRVTTPKPAAEPVDTNPEPSTDKTEES